MFHSQVASWFAYPSARFVVHTQVCWTWRDVACRNEVWHEKFVHFYSLETQGPFELLLRTETDEMEKQDKDKDNVEKAGADADADVLNWFHLCVQCDSGFKAPYRLSWSIPPSSQAQNVRFRVTQKPIPNTRCDDAPQTVETLAYELATCH